jgi:Protein of unknown function (DUF2806)
MADGNPLINLGLGDLTKPATTLIEKISDAIEGFYKPYQIKRIAAAEAKAEIIKAEAQIEVTELQRRALVRFVAEEARKQDNIEQITHKAIPQLEESSNPQNIEDDWIVNFFDKCRIISDEAMQSLWARILAGEANSPGKYSKRTVNFLSSLEKIEAKLFTALCGFGWSFSKNNVVPLIFDAQESIYAKNGIDSVVLRHLDSIGILIFNTTTPFRILDYPKRIKISYYGKPLNIEFSQETSNELVIGRILLTEIGKQLAPICGSKPVEGFQDYVFEKLSQQSLILSSPYPHPNRTQNKCV